MPFAAPLVQGHWRLDRDTGIEQPTNDVPPLADTVARDTLNDRLAQCDDRTWSPSPDGSRLACTASGQDIVIVDLGTQKEIERIPFWQQYSSGGPYPAWPLQSTWSPDGQTLLVGIYGENSSSTSSQLDYFLLDLIHRDALASPPVGEEYHVLVLRTSGICGRRHRLARCLNDLRTSRAGRCFWRGKRRLASSGR